MNYLPTPYDIYFRIFRFSVRIHPLFWAVAVLLGMMGRINSMPLWMLQIALLTAAMFVSILVHELGHALIFRYVFRVPSQIVLAFGGVTIPLMQHRTPHGWKGTIQEVLLSAAGPFTGFLLAGFAAVPFHCGFLSSELVGLTPKSIFDRFLDYVIWISIVWGIFNLLPIYPMDGGHISREFFKYFFPYRGVRYSLILSMSVAVILALFALQTGQLFLVFLMGYFAYQNFQEMSFRRRW